MSFNFDLAAADEFNFVFDSWARSFQKSDWAGCIPNHLYPQVSRAGSADILDRGAMVEVAYVPMPDGTRRVMGYSVSEPDRGVLHWVFVKRDYRGLGVGKALVASVTARITKGSPLYYTYRTRASAKFLGPAWEHEPKLARVRG